MYEYSDEANPLHIKLHNTEVQLDNIPTQHPFVPRICKEQGHFIIWYGSKESDPDLAPHSLTSKTDTQWVSCSEDWMVEKAVALVYPYEDEIIIGSVKVAGYMNIRPRAEVRRYIKSLWVDIIQQLGHKRLVCPAGSYLEYLHLSINQKRIPHDAYLASLMIQNGFERHEHYWVRDGSDHKTN